MGFLLRASLLACLTVALNGMVVAQESQLYATNLDGLIQDGSGIYDQALKLMGIPYRALPATRAKTEMEKKKGCMFPIDRRFLSEADDLVQSKPINIALLFIYSKDPSIKALTDLKGKSLGLRHGISYGQKVNDLQRHGQRFIWANTLESSFKKLALGRVDAIIEFEPDMNLMFKKHPDITFIKSNTPVDAHADAMTCFNTPENIKLIAHFNDALTKSRKDIDTLIGK